MKVTVCELNDDAEAFTADWVQLVRHAKEQGSDLVLLPELPFCPWFGRSRDFDEAVWHQAVAAHELWLTRVHELAPAAVLATRPVTTNGRRFNEAFVWREDAGVLPLRHKYLLPDEPGFFEASWYSAGPRVATTLQCGSAVIGVQICTELWDVDHARVYGIAGAHIIVTPRATPAPSLDNWQAAARTVALVSGAFSLSSNHVSSNGDDSDFGGCGWIIAPDGEVLALTSREQPFVTLDIDLAAAEAARQRYPHSVLAGYSAPGSHA